MKSPRRYWIIASVYAGALLGMGAAIYLRLTAESRDPDKHAREAVELHRNGRFDEAVRSYESALSLKDDPVLRASLSRALTRLGQVERAARELVLAAEGAPNHAEIWHDLGLVKWHGLNDRAGADQAFAKAAALPDAKPEVEFDRGMLLLSMQRMDDAGACLESALARAPDNASWRAQAEEALVITKVSKAPQGAPAPR
jgi:Flp pilus assembly protein TadD